MRVALVHDFLTQLGGAERVLECLHEMFPKAPVFTLVYDERKTAGRYRGWDIRTSFIQKLPFSVKRYKWYLPLMPKAIESFDLSGFDLVISDASAFAKGVKVPEGIRHICYCHTPTRYLWQMMDEYVDTIRYPKFVKIAVKPFLKKQKLWDYAAAQKIDIFLANSYEVQKRIKLYYGRESEVIYPPVDTGFFRPATLPKRDYFLTAGRMEPYKRFDLVLQCFQELGLPLIVAGTGTMKQDYERSYANFDGSNIKFLGKVSDQELLRLYQNARAFIFPAHEDAGIMIVEAMSAGTPIIAYGAGGALEFVRSGETGLLFSPQTKVALKKAVTGFDSVSFNTETLVKWSAKFSKSEFKQKITEVVEKL